MVIDDDQECGILTRQSLINRRAFGSSLFGSVTRISRGGIRAGRTRLTGAVTCGFPARDGKKGQRELEVPNRGDSCQSSSVPEHG